MNKNGGEGLMSTLLFKHVNVVDVRNQQILSDVDVLIKNERIEKILMQKPCMCFWNGFVAVATNLIE